MEKSKRIYFHKEDVWRQGEHWMTSASRDIFEHFYKSIKATFLNHINKKEIKELVEKIQNIREWEKHVFESYSNAAQNKTLITNLVEYSEKRIPLPEEIEYDGDNIVPKDQMIYDPTIYPDFETFFEQADHGWIKNAKGKETCFGLYKNFIKDITVETLQEQMETELFEAKQWRERLDNALIAYMKNSENLKWHQFLSKNIENF